MCLYKIWNLINYKKKLDNKKLLCCCLKLLKIKKLLMNIFWVILIKKILSFVEKNGRVLWYKLCGICVLCNYVFNYK